jgi:hypothetical protein
MQVCRQNNVTRLPFKLAIGLLKTFSNVQTLQDLRLSPYLIFPFETKYSDKIKQTT